MESTKAAQLASIILVDTLPFPNPLSVGGLNVNLYLGGGSLSCIQHPYFIVVRRILSNSG